MPDTPPSLERFKTAQASPESGYLIARAELEAGLKTSHWIWYVLPQLAELGRSSTAKFYGIADATEAEAYLRDDLLRDRLSVCFAAIERHLAAGVPVTTLMGGAGDANKLTSCATLFHLTAGWLSDRDMAEFSARCERVLRLADAQGFPACAVTQAHFSR